MNDKAPAKRPDLDDYMAQGMTLTEALAAWSTWRPAASAHKSGPECDLSAPTDKPNTRLQ